MAGPEIEQLISRLAKLPGLGPRSARRAALALVKKRDTLLRPLAEAMLAVADRVKTCSVCANVDVVNPCHICASETRDATQLCVVQDVADLWAMERSGAFRGRYHILGGTLSALEGIRPEDLNIATLIERVNKGTVAEVILAMNATVDGQTTAHYITDHIKADGVSVSRLAHGVPVGGELDFLDDGTISQALRSRRPF
jgi:recombination protein RecR